MAQRVQNVSPYECLSFPCVSDSTCSEYFNSLGRREIPTNVDHISDLVNYKRISCLVRCMQMLITLNYVKYKFKVKPYTIYCPQKSTFERLVFPSHSPNVLQRL